MLIAFALPGWMIGAGSGVRKMSPARPGAARLTTSFGGVSSGELMNCCSLSGWVTGMLIGGPITPGRETVKRWLIAARAAITTRRRTVSPGLSGWSSR